MDPSSNMQALIEVLSLQDRTINHGLHYPIAFTIVYWFGLAKHD